MTTTLWREKYEERRGAKIRGEKGRRKSRRDGERGRKKAEEGEGSMVKVRADSADGGTQPQTWWRPSSSAVLPGLLPLTPVDLSS